MKVTLEVEKGEVYIVTIMKVIKNLSLKAVFEKKKPPNPKRIYS